MSDQTTFSTVRIPISLLVALLFIEIAFFLRDSRYGSFINPEELKTLTSHLSCLPVIGFGIFTCLYSTLDGFQKQLVVLE